MGTSKRCAVSRTSPSKQDSGGVSKIPYLRSASSRSFSHGGIAGGRMQIPVERHLSLVIAQPCGQLIWICIFDQERLLLLAIHVVGKAALDAREIVDAEGIQIRIRDELAQDQAAHLCSARVLKHKLSRGREGRRGWNGRGCSCEVLA